MATVRALAGALQSKGVRFTEAGGIEPGEAAEQAGDVLLAA